MEVTRDEVSGEVLAQEREKAVVFLSNTHSSLFSFDTVFTCDSCPTAPTCRLAFDGYNTNGDCLAEK